MFLKIAIRTITLALLWHGLVNAKQITPYDTTQPNEFYFTSDTYYVDEDATNAVIEVGFVAGDRSYSGSVNYRSSNGTAVSGQDYTGVTNTLVFSGPAPTKTFTIPIQKDVLFEGNETVQLVLENSGAFITRSNATLIIIDRPPRPQLGQIKTNNALTLFWSTNFPNFILQRSSDLEITNWVNVPTVPTASNGNYSVTTQIVGNAFFRLATTNGPAPAAQ